MPVQVSSVLPWPAQSRKLAYAPHRALWLIQQKCEHTPAPDPDRIPPPDRSSGGRIWRSLPGEHGLSTGHTMEAGVQLPPAPARAAGAPGSCKDDAGTLASHA